MFLAPTDIAVLIPMVKNAHKALVVLGMSHFLCCLRFEFTLLFSFFQPNDFQLGVTAAKQCIGAVLMIELQMHLVLKEVI